MNRARDTHGPITLYNIARRTERDSLGSGSNTQTDQPQTDAEADTATVTCHMAGCDRQCRRDLTRTVVLDATETGVPTETEARLVCARHYYLEAAARESIFWIGFAIFVLLLSPSITGWGWWWT